MTADYFQFQNERLWGRDLHHLPSASAWQQVLARREEDRRYRLLHGRDEALAAIAAKYNNPDQN